MFKRLKAAAACHKIDLTSSIFTQFFPAARMLGLHHQVVSATLYLRQMSWAYHLVVVIDQNDARALKLGIGLRACSCFPIVVANAKQHCNAAMGK